MLGVRVSAELEQRYEAIAERTGRSKSYYVRKALEEAIEDFEDIAIAIERLENPGERISFEEMKKRLELDDEDLEN